MFLTLLNFYILLSLNPLQLFMEFCWFAAVGCFGFKFFCFCFCFFFLCRFPRFLLLPLLSKLWQRRITKFLLLDFLFPFFLYAIFIGFLVSWDFSIWFQFWVFFLLIYSVIVVFIYIGFPFL